MKTISSRTIAVMLLSAALSWSAPAVRADEQAATWTITPYLWAATFDGTVGLPGGGGDPGDGPGYDFGDFWDDLRLGGAMLNVGWRSGRWSVLGDWTYASVRSTVAAPLDILWSGAEGEVRGHILQAAVGYQLWGHRDAHVEALVGLRFYDLETTLDLRGNALPDLTLSGSDRWLDALAGIRGEVALGDRWAASALADVGVGGSRPSWQVVAAIRYSLTWGELVGGWRHLDVAHDEDRYLLDAALTGPFVGIRWAVQ
jgi:hypothetical protein